MILKSFRTLYLSCHYRTIMSFFNFTNESCVSLLLFLCMSVVLIYSLCNLFFCKIENKWYDNVICTGFFFFSSLSHVLGIHLCSLYVRLLMHSALRITLLTKMKSKHWFFVVVFVGVLFHMDRTHICFKQIFIVSRWFYTHTNTHIHTDAIYPQTTLTTKCF